MEVEEEEKRVALWSERILLSEMRRWRARSLARKVALSSSWASELGVGFWREALRASVVGSGGGREDWYRSVVN